MNSERHLYLLLGHSNMAGRGEIGAEDRTPHPRVLSLSVSDDWELAIEPISGGRQSGVGPGLAFGKAMARKTQDVFIGLVPCAVGVGTSKQWQRGGDLYFQAVHRARLAMRHGVLKGVLWHHGETEARVERVARSYTEWLAKLVADLRTDLAAPNLPFVVGQLGEFLFEPGPGHRPYARLLNEMLAQLASHGRAMACVSSKGLRHTGDGVHFDTTSQHELGRRYAAEMARLALKGS